MRRRDPLTQYRVYIRHDKSYTYAAVDRIVKDEEDNEKRKVLSIGRIKDLRFIPNDHYRLMDVSERLKLIFPDQIDISAVADMNKSVETNRSATTKNEEQEKNSNLERFAGNQDGLDSSHEKGNKALPESSASGSASEQYNNRLYGSFWLLDQIAMNAGLHDDLLTTFGGNLYMVNEVLSLGYFPYLSNRNYSRFSKWQNSHATLLDYRLGSPNITKLTQRITEALLYSGWVTRRVKHLNVSLSP